MAADRARLGVSFRSPPEWTLADTSLTPFLGAPWEVFSVGSFDLHPGGDTCAQVPEMALEDMTPQDVFLTLQEIRVRDFPPRQRFGPSSGTGESQLEFLLCLDETERADIGSMRWIEFSESGRNFYLLVAVGAAAPTDRVDAVWRVANSIEIEPAWTGSEIINWGDTCCYGTAGQPFTVDALRRKLPG